MVRHHRFLLPFETMYKSCSLPAAGSNDTMYNYSITYDLISRSGWRKLFARAFGVPREGKERRRRRRRFYSEPVLRPREIGPKFKGLPKTFFLSPDQSILFSGDGERERALCKFSSSSPWMPPVYGHQVARSYFNENVVMGLLPRFRSAKLCVTGIAETILERSLLLNDFDDDWWCSTIRRSK